MGTQPKGSIAMALPTDGLMGDVDRLSADLASTKDKLQKLKGAASVVLVRHLILGLTAKDPDKALEAAGEVHDAIHDLATALTEVSA